MTEQKNQVNTTSISSPNEKEPGHVRIHNELFAFFYGHGDLLGLYALILRETAWGVYTSGKFRKKITMQPGEFITSYTNLRKMTGAHIYTLQRQLSILESMGTIRIEKRGKTLIAIYPTRTAKNSAKDVIKDFPKPKTSLGKKSNSSELNRKQQFRTESLNSSELNRLNPSNSSELNRSSNPLIYIKEDSFKEEGEKKTKKLPPFESEKELGTERGNDNPSENVGRLLSKDANETCKLWFDRTQERFKSRIYSLEEITADLVEIQNLTSISWEDLLIMVKVLNTSTNSIAKKFTRPCEWNDDPFKDGKNYLDRAMELVYGQEGKALKRLIKEAEREKSKQYNKPRIVDSLSAEEIEVRRLARLAEIKSWG